MKRKPVERRATLTVLAMAAVLAGCSGIAPPPPSSAAAALRGGILPEELRSVPPGGATELAQRHFRAGNFGYAAQYFEQAVAADRDDAEAWLGLAAAYDRLHRFDLADRAYAEAAIRAGATAAYHNNLGFSYLLRGERAKALRNFETALELAPESATIRNNLELLRNTVEANAAPAASSLARG